MNTQPFVSIRVASDVSKEDRGDFISSLREVLDVPEPTTKQFAAEWVLFVAFMKDVGIIAGGATALLKLANEIIDWRDRVRSKKGSNKIRLQRPGKSELDLEKATDEDIRKWIEKE